jgi:hypothetical protein
MWIGASIFLTFMWGMGFGTFVQSHDENKIKVIQKIGR